MSKRTIINKHTVELADSKQPLFGLMYNLGFMKLKSLKTYIKINQLNGFFCLFKSLADAFIFFAPKTNGSLWLYIDYQDLNNLTIKNCYLLLLINKFPYQLSWAKQFT